MPRNRAVSQRRRGRGVPASRQSSDQGTELFDPEGRKLCYSITVAKGDGKHATNLELRIIDSVDGVFEHDGVIRGSGSVEKGTQNRNRHLQMGEARRGGKRGEGDMKKWLKQKLGIITGSGHRVALHQLCDTQDTNFINGYCNKNVDEDHNRNWVKGFTAEDIKSSVIAYREMTHSFTRDKMVVSRSNMIDLVYGWCQKHFEGKCPPHWAVALVYMVRSRVYCFAPSSLVGGQNYVDPARFNAFWKMINTPWLTDTVDVRRVITRPSQFEHKQRKDRKAERLDARVTEYGEVGGYPPYGELCKVRDSYSPEAGALFDDEDEKALAQHESREALRMCIAVTIIYPGV